MNKESLYISTICQNATALAEKYGLGLEIAEYCTAYNMDRYYEQTHRTVMQRMRASDRFVFHAPFNELCPAAIDPLVVDVTERRFTQALDMSFRYGIKKIVIHSGYVPLVYYKTWFHERSVEFWKRFMQKVPNDAVLCLENVMEDSPDLLCGIVKEVNDPRFRLCLDVGHSNTMISDTSPEVWAETCLPYLAHVHLHNNVGKMDLHDPVGEGTVNMRKVLTILEQAENVTYTLESLETAPSIDWLIENRLLRT